MYARANQGLFRELMSAALEAMGITGGGVLEELDDGTHMMMVNCFPACPEPELTLGMPPHSDYGFLTLLLQDQVNGLEVCQADGDWLLVDPLPGSLIVNVGDHLEVRTYTHLSRHMKIKDYAIYYMCAHAPRARLES